MTDPIRNGQNPDNTPADINAVDRLVDEAATRLARILYDQCVYENMQRRKSLNAEE